MAPKVRFFLFSNALPLLACMYFCLSIIGKDHRHKEIYPFFNWSLFSNTPSLVTSASIEVLSIDGKRLTEPADVILKPEYLRVPKMKCASILMKLMKARIKDPVSVLDLQKRIENAVLRDDVSSYRLISIQYHPVERFKTGKILNHKVIGTYRDNKRVGVQALYESQDGKSLHVDGRLFEITSSSTFEGFIDHKRTYDSLTFISGYALDKLTYNYPDSILITYKGNPSIEHFDEVARNDIMEEYRTHKARLTGFTSVFTGPLDSDSLSGYAFIGKKALRLIVEL